MIHKKFGTVDTALMGGTGMGGGREWEVGGVQRGLQLSNTWNVSVLKKRYEKIWHNIMI